MDRWFVGLDAWIIQDGNYTDLAVGDELEFAVDFYPYDLEPTDQAEVSARSKKDDHYEVVGLVTYREDDAWAIDFGIGAYEERPPPEVEAGTFVRGTVSLGVDPFLYLEDLARRETMPALVYTWRLELISRQTAPFVETAPRLFERDKSKWGWEHIQRTDAGNDDGGHAAYLLDCVRLPVPAKRTSEKRGGLF